ncbi:16S rRNA (guanine(966)-N(2))-methyltransferase RsmD [Candidatus Bipolaricaulota bacterium]|nr:16S rRNA (guanine(966)-N(2))-methyltransferase RsmD [Candidatus Bipolaricaulota bacterium]
MRIISGSRKGRKLVEWEQEGIRPMRDFVRSALFSILNDFVPDAAFLDLCCGTGSVGLEALSRGASSCLFVDLSPDSCGIVRRNLEALDFLTEGRVIEGDAVAVIGELGRRARRFDVIFIGPPYYQELVPAILSALADGRLLAEDFVVVAEIHHKETAADAYGVLERVDTRRYGDNQLLFYRRADGQPISKPQEESAWRNE